MTARQAAPEELDVAIIGAGVAGTSVAHHLRRARPDWSIALFERTDRVGGRVRSMHVSGIAHPIELGGMRFLTTHRRVQEVVESMRIPTHPFDEAGGTERSFLRGHPGNGTSDPSAGAAYDLAEDERGRSAFDLGLAAFRRIVPETTELDAAAWSARRATGRYLERPLTDWAIGDALASVLSPDGHRFVSDAFGYDSGVRPFNAGDAIEYVLGGGNPIAEARVPDEGMDAIPRSLAAAFVASGGTLRLEHDRVGHEVAHGMHTLRFANGAAVGARRVVVTTPVPATRVLAGQSPLLAEPAVGRILDSVEPIPAVKLYLWYERPWWLPGPPRLRLVTDLPLRKVFYFGTDVDGPATLLATYTDGRHTTPWQRYADGLPAGSPAPTAMLAEVDDQLRTVHPDVATIPPPSGSALMSWGSDPRETGWHFWRAGYRSDAIIAAALQPDPSVELYLCGEAFSRSQGWVEGALETAAAVVAALTDGRRAA